ncbi:2-oxoglutarate dehydrogenase complex dihydrolipoyllysine-residue succinyltransferase [Cerasicoccus fimbriatus]|uniref:2-oxoglutarate dehydrogenase complex dihydrolipoyllysine-residue succinyltransferase n=1 Tax=Cerasicoccus fimbriatus TaxID=3014554 RepID=UPI0022B57EA1|nr:2-oxoglutarate dehydrogenase complex dihydrolipoyllysine-residue succinyltransferase [Cerasicoccus sp. TK19100]
MAVEMKIPALGESITSGIIAAWHVAEGDYVEKDQVIFELETDKITSEGLAEASGVISLKADEGDEVEIGQIVAVIDDSAAKPGGGSSESTDSDDSEGEAASEAPAPKKDEKPAPDDANSPAVRRIAAETGIDPKSVDGSGKGGRVTKGDMLAAQDRDFKAAPAESPTKPSDTVVRADQPEAGRTTRKKMTPLRRKIAERLVAATNEAALLTTFNEVDMSAVMKLRKQHQDKFVEKYGVKLGFMSFFVKAVVNALQEVPDLNTQLDGDHVIQNHFYDIGVAVGSDKGLMVPVVRDCDSKNFATIEQDIIAYAKAARSGKIKLEDLNGGVFTISNGGIYGSMLSTPLLNMPQTGILGLHNITERAVVINGEIVARPMMYLALSYDHRVVDGKGAVTFLVKIKEAIEDPTKLLFGV